MSVKMYWEFRCVSQNKTYIHASHHTDLVSSSDHRPALMSRPHSLVLTAPFFIPLLQPPHLSSVSSSSSPSSSSPARGTLGFSASGLLSNSRSTQYKAFFFSTRDLFWLFCFVNSNESQNKHAFNPVINILTENISRLASDAFCVLCFNLFISPFLFLWIDLHRGGHGRRIHFLLFRCWSIGVDFSIFLFRFWASSNVKNFLNVFDCFLHIRKTHNSCHSNDIHNSPLQFKERA